MSGALKPGGAERHVRYEGTPDLFMSFFFARGTAVCALSTSQ